MTSMRVTQQMAYLQAVSNLNRNYGKLFLNQQQIASGTRVGTASDDPTGTAQLLGLARRAGGLATFRRNISAGQSALDSATSDLNAIADVFHQARERVVQALNGTLNESDRVTLANEIDQHLTSILGFANSQVAGSYEFAGSRSDTVPFVRTTGADGIERVVYNGDSIANRAGVAPGLSEAINVPGSRLIDVGPRTITTYGGTTGARAGAGTDSGVGRATLTVSHLITGFGPVPGALSHGPSGLRAGASSAASDTVLGYGHALTLNVNAAGTGGTVSLNGGAAIAFTTANTNLAVTGREGETVHLDLSQVVAGFNGQVQVDSYGTLSLDGGHTTVPINFFSNGQQVTNSADGSVTYIDATGISRTGVANVTYGGTLDLFNSLLAIRDLLRTTGTQGQVSAAVEQARLRLADLDRGEDAILKALSDAGAVSTRLDALDSRLADVEVDVEARRSRIQDTDLATALTDLQANEAVYQSSLLVTARLSRISLANFL